MHQQETLNEAWHGVGTVVSKAPTVQEAIKMAGLDWTATEKDLYFPVDRGFMPVEDHKVVVRSTDQSVLGVVGKKYATLQNRDAFGFFNDLIEDGTCTLEAAGSIHDGRKIWILAKIEDVCGEVSRGDEIVQYITLYHSHDATKALSVQPMPIRTVSGTAMRVFLDPARYGGKRRGSGGRMLHKSGMKAFLRQTKGIIDIARHEFDAYIAAFKDLRRRKMPVRNLEAYVREVFLATDRNLRTPRAYPLIEQFFLSGPGAELAGETAWGAFCAVCQWVDYERGRTPETRLEAAWNGQGAQNRQNAYELATKI